MAIEQFRREEAELPFFEMVEKKPKEQKLSERRLRKEQKLSERSLRRKVEQLKRRVRRHRRRREQKRERRRRHRRRREQRRRRLRDHRIADIIGWLPSRFSQVRNGCPNRPNKILWDQADALLQRLTRDVLDEIACRWSKGKPIPILSQDTVRVRDNKAIISKRHCDSMNYAEQFWKFNLSVFGPVGDNGVLKDFGRKLCAPGLTLLQFQNLYFHKFLQSLEDITGFPVVAIQNLRRLRTVPYGDEETCNWTNAYRRWLRERYPESPKREIDLGKACSKDIRAWRAFNYRSYQNDDPVDEADLVRNLITHFNECRMRDFRPPEDTFDLKQVGEVVFALFPNIGTNLFDFLYECEVYVDFTAARTYYCEAVAELEETE